MRLAPLNRFKPSSNSVITDRSKAVILLWIVLLLVMFHAGVCCAVMYVPISLVVTCWESADLLAAVFVVFCHFPK